MSRITHTRGPWVQRPHGVVLGGPVRMFARGPAQEQIALATLAACENGDTERDANTALIAQAPALLSALQSAIQCIEAMLARHESQTPDQVRRVAVIHLDGADGTTSFHLRGARRTVALAEGAKR